MKNADELLALARAAGTSETRRLALDMILSNKRLDAISKVTGLNINEIQNVKNAFVAKVSDETREVGPVKS